MLLCSHHVPTGKTIHGKVVVTISRGRVVWEGGKLDVAPGSGRFVPMEPWGPLYDGIASPRPTTLQQWVKNFPYGHGTPVKRKAGGDSSSCGCSGNAGSDEVQEEL